MPHLQELVILRLLGHRSAVLNSFLELRGLLGAGHGGGEMAG